MRHIPSNLISKEDWLPYPGFEGLYEASRLGQIYSLISDRILKPINIGNGYLRVILYKACVHIMIRMGIDIRVYAKGSPVSVKFEYDFSSFRKHIERCTEEIRYKIALFAPKGAYLYRYKRKHDYDVIVFNGMSDLQRQAWFEGVRLVFTNDSVLLSTHRLLCRKYYPGCCDDLFEELQQDKIRRSLYE